MISEAATVWCPPKGLLFTRRIPTLAQQVQLEILSVSGLARCRRWGGERVVTNRAQRCIPDGTGKGSTSIWQI